MRSDIDPQSGFRLPLPKREELDEVGQRTYDLAATPGRSVAGPGLNTTLQHQNGAASARLYNYLRFQARFGAATREIAILTVARELDSQFRWVMQEAVALKEGVAPAMIDVIRHRQSTAELDVWDAAELGRQAYGSRRVRPAAFARALALFGANRLVDLVLLIASATTTAALLTVIDMQLRPGMEPTLPADEPATTPS